VQTKVKIYIGLGVLLVIGGLVYWRAVVSQDEAATRTATVASDASKASFKVSSDTANLITKLAIKEKDKPEVVLEKRGEDWWVVKPVEALASQTTVKSTIDNLKLIETKEAINDSPEAPAMYKEYDLEGDQSIQVTAFQGENGADVVLDAFFGKSGTRGQMARLADKPGIWVVKGYASFHYARQVKDWREKAIVKFEEQNVVSVALDNEEGKYSFSKNGDDWSGTRNKTKIARLDPEKIKDMLRAFKGLNAEDFADDKANAADETGLGDKPAAVLTIVLKDDAGTIKLVFGNTSTGSSRYLKKDGDPLVYIVGTWAADWATAKVDKFQKAEGQNNDSDSAPPMDTHNFDFGMPHPHD